MGNGLRLQDHSDGKADLGCSGATVSLYIYTNSLLEMQLLDTMAAALTTAGGLCGNAGQVQIQLQSSLHERGHLQDEQQPLQLALCFEFRYAFLGDLFTDLRWLVCYAAAQ